MENEMIFFDELLCVTKLTSDSIMKIILAEHFGMCFGVRDAIAQAEQIGAKGELTILGELVHNPIVRERLHAQGIREAGLGHALPQSARVMITAHGASDARRAELRAAGFKVADATCPLVHHAHDALKRLVAAGFFPVVIGKAGHVEVEGLIGDFPDAIVLSSEEDVRRLPQLPALRNHFANNAADRIR